MTSDLLKRSDIEHMIVQIEVDSDDEDTLVTRKDMIKSWDNIHRNHDRTIVQFLWKTKIKSRDGFKMILEFMELRFKNYRIFLKLLHRAGGSWADFHVQTKQFFKQDVV
jgi:hypothetical protein